MKMVFLDMDGVLADLEFGLYKFSGFKLNDSKRNELFKKQLPAYVEMDGFATSPVLEGAQALVSYLLFQAEEGLCDLAILTSTGHFASPNSKVVDQKKRWLESNFPELYMIPFCCTTSGAQKSLFAHENSILIDDHVNNIAKFNSAGGHGILYDHEKSADALIQLGLVLDGKYE